MNKTYKKGHTTPKKEKKGEKKREISTLKRRISVNVDSLTTFQKEITLVFFEILLMVKLFHWKTTSYATHKATDELYTKLNGSFDSFMEILLGKSGMRTNLMHNKTVRLIDLHSSEELKREVDRYKDYLVNLTNHPAMKIMSNTDLYNIRDTILGDMNQFLYLLTFQ
jgi:hypothetical protein